MTSLYILYKKDFPVLSYHFIISMISDTYYYHDIIPLNQRFIPKTIVSIVSFRMNLSYRIMLFLRTVE